MRKQGITSHVGHAIRFLDDLDDASETLKVYTVYVLFSKRVHFHAHVQQHVCIDRVFGPYFQMLCSLLPPFNIKALGFEQRLSREP